MLTKKGLSDYISHILAIAIAFLILSLVASSMYDYYVNLTLESQRSEATAVSEDIAERMMDMYSEYRDKEIIPGPGEKEVLKSVELDVPDNIGGRNYDIRLNSSNQHWIEAEIVTTSEISIVDSRRPTARIVVEVTEFPEETYTYHLYNIETGLDGEARNPDRIRLEYIRKRENDKTMDTIEMSRA